MSMLPATDVGPTEETGPLTAEGLLRRRARQRPNATALADPPNRVALGLGPPRSLTYREADAAVDALASFLIELGLEPGDRIAVQLPNVIEAPLTLLAAWRAGLTVAALPLLWRGLEIGRICEAVEPKALVGVSEFAGDRYAEMLREIAVAHLSVRFVLGFGAGLPDGVASLDEAIDVGMAWSQTPSRPVAGKAPALINFSARRDASLVPLFRSEEEILAQGAMTVLALSLDSRDVILNPYPFTGPPGLSLALAPWLISGATLVQHSPFEYPVFVEQLLAAGATVTALPAALLAELAADVALQGPRSKLKRVGCVWSAAELAKGFSAPHGGGIPVFDLYPLGDLASLVLRRTPRPDPSVLPLGNVQHGDSADSAVFVETKIRTADGEGEIVLRGPVVPHAAEDGPAAPDAGGFVGTGLRGGPTTDGRSLRVERDPELLHHGGFAIAARELDALYQAFPGFLDAACFTLPDPIVGDRIFAAVVPTPSEAVSLAALHRFLAERGAAPYKFPDKLVVVRDIPRDAACRVLREKILQQV